MNLTRDHLGIWVINLPKDSQRRERMERQLGDLRIKFNLFDVRLLVWCCSGRGRYHQAINTRHEWIFNHHFIKIDGTS